MPSKTYSKQNSLGFSIPMCNLPEFHMSFITAILRSTKYNCVKFDHFVLLTDDKIPPGFPSITPPPSIMVVEVGHTATLPCQATGNPTPKIRWLWNSLPLDVASNPRYALLNDKMHGEYLDIHFRILKISYFFRSKIYL